MKKNKTLSKTIVIAGLVFVMAIAIVIYNAPQFARAGQNLIQPIRLVDQELTAAQILAQELALDNRQVSKLVTSSNAEVMGVYPLVKNGRSGLESCTDGSCYRTVIYDFDENSTITAFVHLNSETVLDAYRQPNSHPELNDRLVNLAYDIIQNDQDVEDALGFRPDRSLIWVAESNRIDTECDGTHYCVAAVFTLDSGSVWAMVDLTDESMEKIWWSGRLPDPQLNVYDQPHAPETVRALLDCGVTFNVDRDGWKMDYLTTPTDSLELSDITFNNGSGDKDVAASIKLLEWHAHYPGGWGFVDYTGCGGGGGGFPIYPFGVTQVLDLLDPITTDVIGFEVVQDFRMSNWGGSCNYRYEQHFEFYEDGRFRVGTRSFGQGCGNDTDEEATYRPVIRMDIDVDGGADDAFAAWDGSGWADMLTEDWKLQDDLTSPDGYDYAVTDTATDSGYYIEQGRGQYDDNGTGDNAYLYVTQYDVAEGVDNMPTIGACCTGTHVQGPDQYVNGESVDSENIVLWYVPQSRTITTWEVNQGLEEEQYCWTDDTSHTWPCISGPMFIPISSAVPDETISGLAVYHDGPTTVGETTTFTATLDSGTNVKYSWSFDEGVRNSGPVATHIFTTTGVYTATVTAVNNSSQQTAETTVNIIDEAIVGLTAFHDGPTVPGETTTFTATVTDGSNVNYLWDFGNGQISGQVITHTFMTTGIYTATVTAVNTLSQETAETTVNVIDEAIVGLTASHDGPTMLGDTTTLTATVTAGSNVNYFWDFGNGQMSGQVITHTFTTAGIYTATVTAVNDSFQETVETTVNVIDTYYLYLPNILKPDVE